MIEIENKTIGSDDCKVLTILDENINSSKYHDPNGYVQSEYRIFDGKSEGTGLCISVFDSQVAKDGRYSPHDLSKEELKVFISFLQECLTEIEQQS